MKSKELIKYFYTYQKKYFILAVLAGILMLINIALKLPMPLLTRYIIDEIVPSQNFKGLNTLCFILFGVILLNQASNFSLRYVFAKYKAKVHFDLEKSLYLHVQKLPLKYFSRRSSGYILSRIGEVSSIDSAMADTFLFMCKDIITMAVGAVLILKMNFPLGLVSIFILPLFVFSLKIFHKKIKGISKKQKEIDAQYKGKLATNIDSIEKIKSDVKEEEVGNKLSEKLFSFVNIRFRAQIVSASASAITGFISLISPFIVLWFGVSEIMKGSLTLGTFIAINAMLGYLYGPAQNLTNTGYKLSQAMAVLERIYGMFKEKEEEKSGLPIDNISNINFERVNFAYSGTDYVIRDLNLKINRGEKVALVGESGQGKSTLVKMILKFYEPSSGLISFTGEDSRSIENKSLRKKIAYISQKKYLLQDELKQIIGQEEVKSLLKKFRLKKSFDDFDIFQSEFSGGELQKIELIESMLKDADILIIDEGTSNIDFNSEKVIFDELFAKYKDKIIILIAHRLTSVINFPRILVMHHGKIVEQGTHTYLMKKKGRYHSFWGTEESHK